MSKDKNVLNKLVSGTTQGLFGSIGGKFLGVVGSIIAARILGPSIFGLYAIGWTLLRFVTLIIPLGMDRALLRFAPKFFNKDPQSLKGLFKISLLTALSFSLFVGSLQFTFSPWLAQNIYQKPELVSIFRLFAVAIPLVSILAVVSAATRVTQNIKLSVLIQDLGQPLLGLGLMIVFSLAGMGLNGVIYSELASFFIAATIGYLAIFHVFPEIRQVKSRTSISLKELLAYSIPAAFSGAFSVYILWIDRIFVGLLLSPSANGIYLAISQISTIFMVISAGINLIAVPMFSDLYHKKDMASLEEIYKISTKWGIYFGLPILIVLMVSPADSITLIYGELYRGGAGALIVLLVGQAINLFTGSINPLLIMTGNEKAFFRISAIVFLLSIVLNIVLVPSFGLVGAALSTTIGLIVLYVFALFWGKYKLGLWPYDRRFIKGIIAAIITTLAVVGIKCLHIRNILLNIIAQSFVAVIVFVLALFLLKFEDEDIGFLKNLTGKFRP